MSKNSLVSLLVVATLAASGTAAAAETSYAAPGAVPPAAYSPETLFGGAPSAPHIGWYVAPTSGFTSLAGRRGYVAGLRAAVMINQRFGFGLAGNLIGTDETLLGDREARDVGGYGGAYVQYVLRSSSVVHAYVDATVGSGGWCAQSFDDGHGGDCNVRRFAFLEPTANLEVNLTNNLRFATGLGYRAAIAERGSGLSSADLSGVVARGSLIVGMF